MDFGNECEIHIHPYLATAWQRYADRVQPFFLPTYAPQLNLIEDLWGTSKFTWRTTVGGTISADSNRQQTRSSVSSPSTSIQTRDRRFNRAKTYASGIRVRVVQTSPRESIKK
jgi:hypothetical protein